VNNKKILEIIKEYNFNVIHMSSEFEIRNFDYNEVLLYKHLQYPIVRITKRFENRKSGIEIDPFPSAEIDHLNNLLKWTRLWNEEKILNEIQRAILFIDDEDAKEYDIKKNTNGEYVPDTSKIKKNVKTLKQKSTFTYNLLNNIDISPKEIQTAYCKKWTKDICKEDDTPVILMKRMLYYYVFEAPSRASDTNSNVVGQVKQETKSVRPSIFNKLPYTYVPGYDISINGVATVKTVYGAIFGFDEKWLDNILGILDPIVDTVFDEIKNSDLDFTTLLLSSISGKTEKEIDDFFVKHQNTKKLKDELNEFLKKNADSFSKEYKTTHYIGFSEEFQKKIKNAATETMKAEIETEYYNIEERVAEKILKIATGVRQFQRELLLFIIAQDNMDDFDNLLENNKKPIDVLEKEARSKLKIQ
jgi:hypothetical protein